MDRTLEKAPRRIARSLAEVGDGWERAWLPQGAHSCRLEGAFLNTPAVAGGLRLAVLPGRFNLNGLWPRDLYRRHGKVVRAAGAVPVFQCALWPVFGLFLLLLLSTLTAAMVRRLKTDA